MRKPVITSELCSKYHPDMYCNIISDAILTKCLEQDKGSHVACEVLAKDNTIVLAGEITTKAIIGYDRIVKEVADELGYKVDNIINLISQQSPQINQAVTNSGKEEDLGAGDQGIMWGYAVNDEQHNYLPYGLWLADRIISSIENDIAYNPNSLFKGDAKCQVVDDNGKIKEILISACHRENYNIDEVRKALKTLLVMNNIITEDSNIPLVLNPSGVWTVGGPAADCGLTGRKIVCDSYGGYAPIGGGAYSGKSPEKLDRSGAYMARAIAREAIIENGLEECTVQLSYGIGLKEPRSVSAYGIKKGIFGIKRKVDISDWVKKTYDLTPYGIIKYLKLDSLNYKEIAQGNHMKWF